MSTLSPALNTEKIQGSYSHKLNQIEDMLRIPFSQSVFLQYSKTLSATQKADIIRILKIDLAKKWTDILFIKKLSIALRKVSTDTTMMKQLLLFINKNMMQADYSLKHIDENIQNLVQEHGPWAVYWNIFYHTERLTYETQATNLLERIQQSMHKSQSEKEEHKPPQTSLIHEGIDQLQQLKHDKRLALLEAKAAKEAQLRIQLEQDIVKLEKQTRSYKYESEKQMQTQNQLKQQFNEALQQLKKQDQQLETFVTKKREEEERWLQERASLLQQGKKLSEENKKLQQHNELLVNQLEEAKKQVASLTLSQNNLQKQKETPRLELEKTEKLIHALQYRLHKRIDRANQTLIQQLNSRDLAYNVEEKQQQLTFLQATIALIEQTERYMNLVEPPRMPDPASKKLDSSNEHIAPVQETAGYYGTFYRRDHGGYVELDSGERFNITESLVQQLELQHEAEVLCTPNQTTGKSAHYTIEIVFQGDDEYSPISSYDGYVYSDSDGKWYCVDMNDESTKFPIHFKDIDIQKPAHGDPCTFNVANDGHIARLTKLYRLLPGETYENRFPAKKNDKNKSNLPQMAKEKPQPYLSGCTITIIGGLRKWFESVVKETGAELVHNGGERPERIAADLARSQALFMILTSTSHRATWEGVEIAKANQIPHFTIQGSKSNLRSILWDNQQLIRETNRAQ